MEYKEYKSYEELKKLSKEVREERKQKFKKNINKQIINLAKRTGEIRKKTIGNNEETKNESILNRMKKKMEEYHEAHLRAYLED
jgi:hypothetical protein